MWWFIYWLSRLNKKNATINPKTEDDKCFQNALMVALNYEEIESHPEGFKY